MKTYWTTRDGKHIDVDLMDESHLRNTLKMLIKKQERKEHKKKVLDDYYNECDATEIDL